MESGRERERLALMSQLQHLTALNMNSRLLIPIFKFIVFFLFQMFGGKQSILNCTLWTMAAVPQGQRCYRPSKEISPEHSCHGQPSSDLVLPTSGSFAFALLPTWMWLLFCPSFPLLCFCSSCIWFRWLFQALCAASGTPRRTRGSNIGGYCLSPFPLWEAEALGCSLSNESQWQQWSILFSDHGY